MTRFKFCPFGTEYVVKDEEIFLSDIACVTPISEHAKNTKTANARIMLDLFKYKS